MFKVEWSGGYPNLCSGEWTIFYNDIKLTIPVQDEDSYYNRRTEDMGTAGEYSRWYFDENYSEETEYYQDGLECGDWIVDNKDWLDEMFDEHKIPKGFFTYHQLFKAIQEQDWRSGSCGGCI